MKIILKKIYLCSKPVDFRKSINSLGVFTCTPQESSKLSMLVRALCQNYQINIPTRCIELDLSPEEKICAMWLCFWRE